MAAAKKGAKKAAKSTKSTKSTKTTKAKKTTRKRRDPDARIAELEEKIRAIKAREASKELANDPVFKALRAVRRTLGKAVKGMDGRSGNLTSEFVKASRQFFNLRERELDSLTGKKRRGRKPKVDLD